MQPDATHPETAGVRAKLAELGDLGNQTTGVERTILSKSMALRDQVQARLAAAEDPDERERLLAERARLDQTIAQSEAALSRD